VRRARGPVGAWLAVATAALVTLTLAGCQSGTTDPGAGHTKAAATPARSSQPPEPMPAGNAAGSWHLIFQDGFNSPALDTVHWSVGWLTAGVTAPVQRQELECYDPAQVHPGGGNLDLVLIHKPEACGGRTRPFASGLVNTRGKFFFSYGFLEARIWLPGKRRVANWPAFWAAGQNWPKDGEIDVLEGLKGKACWHFINATKVRGNCTTSQFAGGWHTYGADWEPGSITYYYDGHVMGTIRSGITSAPMYLILNNATDPKIGGHVLAPATMQVDYVRVWQHGR
jgi:beta-glucanase (GH16 family)